jgi:sugar phosphate isomerase/epimerase
MLLAGATLAAGATFGPAAAAIDPIKRNGKTKMKLSLAAYSFRDQLTGKKEPKWTLDEFIEFCAAQGLDGTELTGYYFPRQFPQRGSKPPFLAASDSAVAEYLAHLKHKTFLLGLDVSGTAIANDFCLPPGEDRDREIAFVKQWADYAAAFGARCIRVFSGNVPKGHTEDEAIRWCVEAMEECCRHAGERGVFLALENHGGISVPAERLVAIVREVRSPWFGVNLDTGNFNSEDPYADMTKLAPYAITVQVKTEITPKGSTKQPADMARIIRILRDANYRGYVALEYEAAADANTAVPPILAELRKLIG